MTRKEAITVLNMIEAHGSLAIQAKDMAIKALEQEPCEDCISRKRLKECFHRNVVGAEAFDTIIDMQPSIQPKTGQWIDDGQYADGHSEHAYRCSECDEHYIGYVGEYKYCPNCGAKMQEVQE